MSPDVDPSAGDDGDDELCIPATRRSKDACGLNPVEFLCCAWMREATKLAMRIPAGMVAVECVSSRNFLFWPEIFFLVVV